MWVQTVLIKFFIYVFTSLCISMQFTIALFSELLQCSRQPSMCKTQAEVYKEKTFSLSQLGN